MPELYPFRLSLHRSAEPFRREIEYVCNVLEDWYPIKRSPREGPVLHYGPRPPKDAISVPARLFPDGVAANDDGLTLQPERRAELIAGLTLPRAGSPTSDRSGARALDYDAIGLIFLMLSRLEERGADAYDRYGRFPHETALAARIGRAGEPLADMAADALAALILGNPAPARKTDYTVVLTHDVDRLRGYHRWHEPLRYALGDAVKRGRPGGAVKRLGAAYFTGEPLRSMRALMDMAEQRGLQSRFYLMGPSRDPMDSPYAITMRPLLRGAAAEIRSRGHVIGFHPGYGTARDRNAWLAQKAGLEAVIDLEVSEGRQHVLDYDAAQTPDIWEAGGMTLDTTLAFPELTGFRAASCRPFPAYSLRRRKRLALRQVCTAIMDFSLFGGRYRDLSLDQALEEGRDAAALCRRYGGSLVLLHHTGQASDKRLTRFFGDLLAEVA